jgi:SOS response regulatory protein OraA/RecX
VARPERGPLDVAARALRARDLSRKALGRRLATAGFDEEDRRETLDRLCEAGLIDDLRLARSRAERLAARGWGDRGIAAKLAAEGIGREDADVAIGELAPERERAVSLAGAARSVPPARLASRLRARGFGEEAIRSAIVHLDVSDDAELR